MATLSPEDRITRLEDVLKAVIDGMGLTPPGGMATPRATAADQLAFSKVIAEERRAAK